MEHLKQCAFALVMVLSLQGCSSHFFFPDKLLYRTPDFYHLSYEDVFFDSDDGTSLHGWHIYPKGTSKGMLFVAHGNAQNLSSHFTSWVWLVEEGFELFIFDYRAYGKSQGEIDLQGSVDDTKAALDTVEKRYRGDYVVCGQSLGGTMLLNALEDRDNEHIRAVVIDSTFAGFAEIAQEKMNSIWLTWPFQWIPFLSLEGGYDAIEKIGMVDKPLLLMHGSLDHVISANNSWQLFEASRQPKEFWIVKGAGHIQAFENRNVQKDFLEFMRDIDRFYNPDLSRMKIYESFEKADAS